MTIESSESVLALEAELKQLCARHGRDWLKAFRFAQSIVQGAVTNATALEIVTKLMRADLEAPRPGGDGHEHCERAAEIAERRFAEAIDKARSETDAARVALAEAEEAKKALGREVGHMRGRVERTDDLETELRDVTRRLDNAEARADASAAEVIKARQELAEANEHDRAAAPPPAPVALVQDVDGDRADLVERIRILEAAIRATHGASTVARMLVEGTLDVTGEEAIVRQVVEAKTAPADDGRPGAVTKRDPAPEPPRSGRPPKASRAPEPDPAATTKVCNECGKEKPLVEFYRGTGTHGRVPKCKPCWRDRYGKEKGNAA